MGNGYQHRRRGRGTAAVIACAAALATTAWLQSVGAQTASQLPAAVGAADPFQDVVRPILEQRCAGCHNDQLRSGGFSTSSHESIMKPGASGRTIVARDAAGSELLRRIKLAPGSPGFMPADGSKMALSADEIAAIEWWVGAGAPAGATVGTLAVDEASARALANVLGSRRAGPPPAPPARPAAVSPAVVEQIYQSGFLVRQVSRENPALVVAPGGRGSAVSPAQWQALKASRDQIAELDLRRSRVKDADAVAIAEFPNVTRLHLEGNELTDAGVRSLTGLQHLAYLNLYGNKGITDASIDTIAGIASLKRVYLWDTGVSAAGVERLRARRSDLVIDAGVSPGGSQ